MAFSGTSSRSTKLVHGGVRYLQKAIQELDYEQYKLVVEALHERKIFLDIAPYLSHQLPIMLPVYKYVFDCNWNNLLAVLPVDAKLLHCYSHIGGGKYLTIGSAVKCMTCLLEEKPLKAVMF
jgi:glycerol-3-phosphate dehydrogenase